jgi:hydrogenase maturation protease
MHTTLICGFGSAHGDDQLGWRVVERLATILTYGGLSIRAARSPAVLLDWLEGIDCLIVCDACQDLGSPGAVHRWRWPDVPQDCLRSAGTHDFGLATVLSLAERLHLLPAEIIIWCAEATGCLPGSPPSGSMEEAVTHIVDGICRDAGP